MIIFKFQNLFLCKTYSGFNYKFFRLVLIDNENETTKVEQEKKIVI